MNKKVTESKIFFISSLLSITMMAIFTLVGILKNNYWSYIIYEKSPMGYYEALLLLICFAILLSNTIVSYKMDKKLNISWLILTIGFLYLSLDEKFGIHEKIREEILKPINIKIDVLFWVEKGDYVLIFLLVIGIILLPIVFIELNKYKKAMLYFVIAMIFTIVSIILDSIYLKGIDFGVQKFMQYLEEIFETTGMLFFLNSFSNTFLIIVDKYKKNLEEKKHHHITVDNSNTFT